MLKTLKEYPAAERSRETMVYECEIPDGMGAGILRPDDLIGADRKFRLRRVWRGTVEQKEVRDVSD